MMHKTKNSIVLASGLALVSSLAIGTPAWSQEDTIAARTERTEEEVTNRGIQKEVVGIKPQAGVMVFNDALDQTDSRAAGAIIVEMNALTSFFKNSPVARNWYLGPSTGVIYSHLGEPSSNFFGSDAGGTRIGQGGSNYLMVPLDLKIGYLFPESNFRVSLRGGGNFTYRSVADAMNFGATTAGPGSRWRMYPNVGADFELGQFVIRPDLTITPGNEVFTGTVGFNIALG
jgi:hypothetical protein